MLMCESCGEEEQDCHIAEAGLCGDCFSVAFQEEAGFFFWEKPCGHPYHSNGRVVAVCTIPHGTEHDHSNVKGWGA